MYMYYLLQFICMIFCIIFCCLRHLPREAIDSRPMNKCVRFDIESHSDSEPCDGEGNAVSHKDVSVISSSTKFIIMAMNICCIIHVDTYVMC